MPVDKDLDVLAQRFLALFLEDPLTVAPWATLSGPERDAWRSLADIAEIVGMLNAAEALLELAQENALLTARLRALEAG